MAATGFDVSALLGQIGGGAPGGPGPGLAPGGPPRGGPPDGGGSEDEPIALLTEISDLVKQYLSVEPDEEDKLLMEKVGTLVQQILAKDQKDRDAAMGGSNVRLLRKSG